MTMPVTVSEWKERLRGVFSFPVTPFQNDGVLDLEGFKANIDRICQSDLAAIFVACGTGEFHALSLQEYAELIQAAKQVIGQRKPLFGGAGMGPVQASEFAKAAADNGADGLLATPPYLITPDPVGLVGYYQQMLSATSLPVILYQRGNAFIDGGYGGSATITRLSFTE